MTTPATDGLLQDGALEGMSDTEKRGLLDARISSMRTALAGVLLDGATNQFSVDITGDQRKARADLLAKQEQSLRGTLARLREIRATVPDEVATDTA